MGTSFPNLLDPAFLADDCRAAFLHFAEVWLVYWRVTVASGAETVVPILYSAGSGSYFPLKQADDGKLFLVEWRSMSVVQAITPFVKSFDLGFLVDDWRTAFLRPPVEALEYSPATAVSVVETMTPLHCLGGRGTYYAVNQTADVNLALMHWGSMACVRVMASLL